MRKNHTYCPINTVSLLLVLPLIHSVSPNLFLITWVCLWLVSCKSTSVPFLVSFVATAVSVRIVGLANFTMVYLAVNRTRQPLAPLGRNLMPVAHALAKLAF